MNILRVPFEDRDCSLQSEPSQYPFRSAGSEEPAEDRGDRSRVLGGETRTTIPSVAQTRTGTRCWLQPGEWLISRHHGGLVACVCGGVRGGGRGKKKVVRLGQA